MPNRQEALHNILGVNPSTPDQYPDTITLPPDVHDSMLIALGKTCEDSRPRSTQLDYQDQRWTGGVTMRGNVQISEDQFTSRNSRLHTLAGLLLPPSHLYTWTVPVIPHKFTVEVLDSMRKTRTRTFSDDQFSAWQDVQEKYCDKLAQLPTPLEVQGSLERPLGSVGHAISSLEGHFVWLRRDVETRRTVVPRVSFHERFKASQAGHAVRDCDGRAAFSVDTPNEDLVTHVAAIEGAVAWALSPTYVSYKSDDPFSPKLQKVTPVDPTPRRVH